MAEILSTPLTVVHVIACVFLMLVVLVQPGKSGGLGAFTGVAAQQVFGGRGAGNILTKTTWVTATVFFFTSITLAYLSSSSDESLEKRTKTAQHETKPASKPVTPAPPPAPAPVAPPPPAPPVEVEEVPVETTASAPAPAASVKAPRPAAPRAPAAPRPATAPVKATSAPPTAPAPAPASTTSEPKPE
jgi:preprotein translocase subunit SecG